MGSHRLVRATTIKTTDYSLDAEAMILGLDTSISAEAGGKAASFTWKSLDPSSATPDSQKEKLQRKLLGKRTPMRVFLDRCSPLLFESRYTRSTHPMSVYSQVQVSHRQHFLLRSHAYAYSPVVNCVVAIAIAVSCVFLLFDVDHSDDPGMASLLAVMQMFTLGIFFAEFVLRIGSMGFLYFGDAWCQFDFALLLLVLANVYSDSLAGAKSEGYGWIAVSKGLRAFRLLKLVRAIQFVPACRPLFVLATTCNNALKTAFYLWTILVFIIYVVAVICTQSVGHSKEARQINDLNTYFGSVGSSMFTLFQCSTFDHWTAVVHEVSAHNMPIAMLVMLTICIIAFAVFNALIAVIVEKTCEVSANAEGQKLRFDKQNEDNRRAAMLKHFKDADTDNSGQMSLSEFRGALRNADFVGHLQVLGINTSHVSDLFLLLDPSGDGEVSIDEFTSGIKRLKGDADAKDLHCVQTMVNKQIKRAEDYSRRAVMMITAIDQVSKRLDKWWMGFEDINGIGVERKAHKRLFLERSAMRDDMSRATAEYTQTVLDWQRGFEVAFEPNFVPEREVIRPPEFPEEF